MRAPDATTNEIGRAVPATWPGGPGHVIVEDPPFMRRLFGDTRFALLWLPLRLYLGYSWLTAG